jgi:hypothetical protein
MPTPTFDSDVYAEGQEYKDDARLVVQFFTEAVKNEAKSAEAGRAIFDEVAMVRIMTPGSRDVMVTRAGKNYPLRFPRQWERFQANQSQIADGTPLEQVPFLSVGQIAELKACNVYTLEQLANLADSVAHKFMGAQKMKQLAVAYLEAAKEAAPFTKLMDELEKRDAQIAVLQQQVAQLAAAQAQAAKPEVSRPAPPKAPVRATA